MKKVTVVLAFVLGFSMLSACGTNNAPSSSQSELSSGDAEANETPADSSEASNVTEEKSIELKFAGIKTDDHPSSIAMRVFEEEVEKNSDTLTVEVYTNGALGQLNDLLSGMTDGSVDMMYNTLTCYPWVAGAEAFNVVAAPFLWNDNDELEAFLQTDEVQGWFENAANESGVRCVAAAGELLPRELTANKPVYSAEDFKGLKVRTAESAIVQSTMSQLGAQPIVVPFADLYMALRQGTVDAQEMDFLNTVNASFYEVQDYYMKTDYIRDVSAIFMSNEVWNDMSAQQQAVVLEAADKAVHAEESAIADQIDAVMETLDQNMTYVEIDIESVKEALGDDFYNQFEGDLWPAGTMDTVNRFKAAYAE